MRVSYGNKTVYAIYVDRGPDDEVGEASMAVADALGLDVDPTGGGTETQEVTYEVLPGSGATQPAAKPGSFKETIPETTAEQIQRDSAAAFEVAEQRGAIRKKKSPWAPPRVDRWRGTDRVPVLKGCPPETKEVK